MNIACPNCQADVEVPEEVMRRGVVRVSCPACSFAFVIRLGDPGPVDPPRPRAPSAPIQGLKSSGRQAAAAGEIGAARPRFVAAETRTTVVVDQRLRDEIEQTGSQIQVESRSPSRQETQLGIGRVGRAPDKQPVGARPPGPVPPRAEPPAAKAPAVEAAAAEQSAAQAPAAEQSVAEAAAVEQSAGEAAAAEQSAAQAPAAEQSAAQAPAARPLRPARPAEPPAEAAEDTEAAEELEPELLQADEEPSQPTAERGFESFRPVREPIRPPPGAEPARPLPPAGSSGEGPRSPARPHPAVPYSPASRYPPLLMPGLATPAATAEAAAGSTPAGAGAAPVTLTGTDAAALMPSTPELESAYTGSLEPMPGSAYQPAPLQSPTLSGAPAPATPVSFYPALPAATGAPGTVYHPGSLASGPYPSASGPPGGPPVTDLEVFVLPAPQAGRTARAFGLLMSVMIGAFLLFGLFVLARNNWSLDLGNVGLMLDRALGRAPKSSQVADSLRGIEVSPPHVGQARLLGGELILTAQGVVKNQDTRPRRYIYVRARLLRHGREVKQAEAPAGNLFSPEVLATLDRKALEGKMNPGGRDRRNLYLEPGQNLEYMVVMFGLPPDYSPDRYSVTAEASQAELPEGP